MSKRKEERTWALQTTATWAPVLQAVELYDGRFSVGTVVLIAGAICNAPGVSEKHTAKLAAWRPPADLVDDGSFAFYKSLVPPSHELLIETLKELTTAERETVQAHVRRACGIK